MWCLRMKGWRGEKETDIRRQQVFHTLQQINKSFQRPQKLCRFNQITGPNSECSLSSVELISCFVSLQYLCIFFLFMSKISLCWFHLHVHALNARDIKVQRSTISTKIALLFRRSHSYFFHLFSYALTKCFGAGSLENVMTSCNPSWWFLKGISEPKCSSSFAALHSYL